MKRSAAAGRKPAARMIPFHALELGREEEEAAIAVLRSGNLVGDGPVSKELRREIAAAFGVPHAVFTTSCTAAFHVGVLASDLAPGDEVILPSFAFVSIANVLVLSGAKPVFVDIDPETFNLDLDQVERAITKRTRAIVPVHYAGQSCDMDRLLVIARKAKVEVWEDAAQAIGSRWKGKPLGSLGRFAVVSFHQTKSVTTGEGGALLTADEALLRRAEVVMEKGTNRADFLRGKVDKYVWIDVGSSFVQSDLLAAVGRAQLAKAGRITARRSEIAGAYLAGLRGVPGIRLPVVREGCEPNWHLFALLVAPERRAAFLRALAAEGVQATPHFVPLHDAPFARKRLGLRQSLPVTERVAASIVRLPIHTRLSDGDVESVVAAVRKAAAAP